MNCRDDCDVCGGSGWFKMELDLQHPLFGKALECPNVPLARATVVRRSGLREEELMLDPDDMLDLNGFENMRRAVEAVVRRGYGFVYIWGEYGTGKTTFLRSLVAAWLRKKYVPEREDHQAYFRRLYHAKADDVRAALEGHGGAAFLKTSRLIEVMTKAEFHPDRDNEQRDISFWLASRLLVLDEFDKVRETPYATEKRFWFLDERYEQAMLRRSTTVMAGNLDPEKSLDGYFYDRLRDARALILWSGDKSFRPVAED